MIENFKVFYDTCSTLSAMYEEEPWRDVRCIYLTNTVNFLQLSPQIHHPKLSNDKRRFHRFDAGAQLFA